MEKVYYKSDFIVEETQPIGGWVVPFTFTYFTEVSRNKVVATYDGNTYKNCKVLDNGNLAIYFDSHNLGTGQLYVQRELSIPDENFSDGVRNDIRVERVSVELIKGVSNTTSIINTYSPPYVVIGGGSGEIPNGSVTENKIANNAVSTSKIKNSSITSDKLASNSVTSDKLARKSVTHEKLSDELRNAIEQGGSGSGTNGKSAYEIWLEQGNTGSEQDFLDSLRGEKGKDGENGDKMTYNDLTDDEKNDLASRVKTGIPIVAQSSSIAIIEPNVLNVWGSVNSLAIEFAGGKEGVVNEYMIQFTSLENTTLILPNSITWMKKPSIQANKVYQISVINNLAVIGEFGYE